MMENKREEKRSSSYARVYLTASRAVGYLRDLSPEGCRMSFLEPPDLEAGRELDVVVVPSPALGIPRIPATFVVRWTQADGPSFFAGGLFASIPPEYRDPWDRLVTYFQGTTGGRP